MAVFTEVSQETAQQLVDQLELGTLTALRGIEGGIENTNYFASTTGGEYVLTLFERLSHAQLPFYLCLMQHLAAKGIPVPAPRARRDLTGANLSDAHGILHTVQGKPAAMVNKLEGRSVLAPQASHCAQVGAMLARMHLAGRDFELQQPNLRGLAWWNETVPVVLPFVTPEQSALLRSELAYQNHVATSSRYAALPRGPIHADLFRDNVLFHDDQLTGFFDFYFAGVDTWLFDIAVCLNDWCIDLEAGASDNQRRDAFLQAYAGVRPLNHAECQLLPAMLRAGALRFWISRLWDLHLPRNATMLQAHDPRHFERVLRQRIVFA